MKRDNKAKNNNGSIEENIRCGLIEILILSMLSKRDMYTYEIIRELLDRGCDDFITYDGSIYGPMYRMLGRNLISSTQKMVGEKRFRNYFHLEDSGREYLEISVKKFYEIYGLTEKVISEFGFKRPEEDKDDT